jgi:hypothetical protein
VQSPWSRRKVLITVRTYPVPAWTGTEISCTAGITEDRQWVRLFPVPYRFLEVDQRFRKYQWVDLLVKRAPRDPRPESHNPDLTSIKVSSSVPADEGWRTRRALLSPLISESLCELRRLRDKQKYPTLGLFKPREIKRLRIEQEEYSTWTDAEMARLRQEPMWGKLPANELVKIPLKFIYDFTCDDPNCHGHSLSCTDWEMGALYLNCVRKHRQNWEGVFRDTYERKVINEWDTHFYVGTVSDHPNNWIIVGIFRPPRQAGVQTSLDLD